MSKTWGNKIIHIFMISTALLLAACAQTPRIKTTDPYQTELVKEYTALAARKRTRLDFSDAGHFTVKASTAAEGLHVQPDNPESRNLDKKQHPKIWSAWVQLKNLPSHVKSAFPKDAARAQAAFDCWLEERESSPESNKISPCERRWNELNAQLQCAPNCGKEPYQGMNLIKSYEVTFNLNSAKLDAASHDTLALAGRELRKLDYSAIRIVGYTDRTGSSSQNKVLAQKRAEAVAAALIENGIAKEYLEISSVGEMEPAIATDDDIKLKANRRVKIDVFK